MGVGFVVCLDIRIILEIVVDEFTADLRVTLGICNGFGAGVKERGRVYEFMRPICMVVTA
jgi:phosphoribosylformylglycinamidine (FGAM) synthase-like amidotransferase family enzyme